MNQFETATATVTPEVIWSRDLVFGGLTLKIGLIRDEYVHCRRRRGRRGGAESEEGRFAGFHDFRYTCLKTQHSHSRLK
jgi:hypothetical protein